MSDFTDTTEDGRYQAKLDRAKALEPVGLEPELEDLLFRTEPGDPAWAGR